MTTSTTSTTSTSDQVQLPAHLVELAKKMEESGFVVSEEAARQIRATQEVTIVDRTPEAYGPSTL